MIYLDMDGVLADLVRQVEIYCETGQIYNQSNFGIYRMQDACPILTFEDVKECFADVVFWEKIPECKWIKPVLDWAKSVADEKEIYILTRPWVKDGPTSARSCLVGKIRWVMQHLPEFADRLIFSTHKEVFAQPNAVLVDDNLENCEAFASAGGKTIFLPTPWGDKNYYKHRYIGLDQIREVLRCATPVVANMSH